MPWIAVTGRAAPAPWSAATRELAAHRAALDGPAGPGVGRPSSSRARPAWASRACSPRSRRRRARASASPGRGRRTSRTAAASRTAGRACSRRSSPTSMGSTRARSCAGSCSPTTCRPRRVGAIGGAIAAIARDAAFSGWEAEAADIPADPAEVARRLAEVAARYLDRLLGDDRAAGRRHRRPPLAGPVERGDGRPRGRPACAAPGHRAGGCATGTLPDWTARDGVTASASRPGPSRTRPASRPSSRGPRVDADGARSIHERTGGNPLFVGETVRAFLEDGTLQWRDGRVAHDRIGRDPTCRSRFERCSALASTRCRPSPRGPRRRLGHRHHFRPGGRRGAARTRRSTPGVLEHLAASALDPAARRRALAIRPRAHPRRRVRGLARESPARPPRAARRPPGGGRCMTAPGQIAAHRVAAGDARAPSRSCAKRPRAPSRSGRSPRRRRSGDRPPTSRRPTTRRRPRSTVRRGARGVETAGERRATRSRRGGARGEPP